MIDPDGKGPLTPSAYDAAMTKAGETIGDISARTPIPESSLRNIGDVGRRETPDVQKVISTYVDDLAAIAEQNGGTIPGETFRKLRSEASAQMRSSNNGDLRRTLGDFVKRMDDALSDHAAKPTSMRWPMRASATPSAWRCRMSWASPPTATSARR